MSDYALFIGWGQPVRGREREAQKVFQEAVQYWQSKQQAGEIEGFEPFSLTPHGGDLAGFLIVRGEREKLAALLVSDDQQRLNLRAGTIVDHFGVVPCLTGARTANLIGTLDQVVADLIG